MKTLLTSPCASGWKTTARHLALAALSVPLAFAQTPPTPAAKSEGEVSNKDEIIILSPFQVDATRDSGYIANRDMTGNRFNTALRDTPVSTTVFTEEMLRDLNVTNVQGALEYAPNVNFTEGSAGAADISIVNMTVRGFANGGAGGSQDFFEVTDDLDAYKVERIGFARGPNGVLFGVGDPGGKATATLKKANLNRNAYEFNTRVDSWGGWRAMADANQVLIKKRAALRVTLLKQDDRDGIAGQFRKDERTFVTGTAILVDRPNFKTTVRGNFESINGDYAVGNVQVIRDQLSSWVNAGRPIGDTVATTPGTIALSATTPRLTYIGGASPDLGIMNWAGKITSTSPRGGTLGNGASILVESLYPYDENPRGSATLQPRDYQTWTGFLEQQIGQDLFIEIAGFRHKGYMSAHTPVTYYLNADPNATLPNGQPNPNAGKYYLENNYAFSNRYTWRNTNRASVSYTLDFERYFEKAGQFLGRHQLFAAFNDDHSAQAFERLEVRNDTPLPGAPTQRNNAANAVYVRTYLDYNTGVYSSGVNLNTMVARDGVTPRALPTAGQDRTLNVAQAKIYAIQSHFLKDRIIGTVGWREDDIDAYNGLGETLRDPVTGLLPLARTQTAYFGSNTKYKPNSKGLVVRPFEWISLQYNKASNFAAAAPSQRTLFNTEIPARSGVGEDYGVRLDLLKDKLTATISYYETSGINSVASQTIGDNINRIWMTLGRPERVASDPNLRDVSDQTAKGYEFTMFYNPTSNWRIYLSITKNNNVVSNVHPNWKAYSALYLADWQAVDPNTPLSTATTPNSTATTIGQAISRTLASEAAAISNEGNTSFNLRKWNGSLTTNYSFRNGFLKGASIGGAVLYRGKAISGYPVVDGFAVRDQPFEEPGYFIANLNFGYDFTVAKKYKVYTKLTVANALDYDGRVIVTERTTAAVGIAPVGTPIRARWIEGTNATLSVGVKF